jgi:hypothetical protein
LVFAAPNSAAALMERSLPRKDMGVGIGFVEL